MSTTPQPQPEVTVNNSAAEIKAAFDAVQTPAVPLPETGQPTPTVPPVAPPAPEWGAIEKTQDGTYQVKLATGEVFKGTADEVIAEQAKAHVNTKRWAQGIREKYEKPPEVPAPTTPPPPAANPEQEAYDEFILEAVARKLGYPDAQALVDDMGTIHQTSNAMRENQLASQFLAAAPDFPNSTDNAGILGQYMDKFKLEPTADNMLLAHAAAIRDGAYKALTPEQQAVSLGHAQPAVRRATPAPMPSTSAPSTAEPDYYKIPLHELKDLVRRGGR